MQLVRHSHPSLFVSDTVTRSFSVTKCKGAWEPALLVGQGGLLEEALLS